MGHDFNGVRRCLLALILACVVASRVGAVIEIEIAIDPEMAGAAATCTGGADASGADASGCSATLRIIDDSARRRQLADETLRELLEETPEESVGVREEWEKKTGVGEKFDTGRGKKRNWLAEHRAKRRPQPTM